MRKVVLLSGGMDSLITYRLFCQHYIPVFVRTGSRYQRHDLAFAQRQAEGLKVLSFPRLTELPSGVVPHRNALLLAYVANRMSADCIAISAPRGEIIWDQQTRFHQRMAQVLRGVTIYNPLRHYTKAQAVGLFLRNHRASELSSSRSCYDDVSLRCGRCPACVKRWIAMRCNGILEQYDSDVKAATLAIARTANVKDLFRYGLRPAMEGWRALRNAT